MAKTPHRPVAGRTAIWIADQDRAIFYRALSRLLETGMPLEQALTLANDGLPSEFQKALESAALRVSKGTSIVQAFVTNGLIPRRDRGILSAAEATGMYVPVFAQLADIYHQRWRRSARMKARFAFPLAVLILAIFVQPLPAVVSGDLSIQAYPDTIPSLLGSRAAGGCVDSALATTVGIKRDVELERFSCRQCCAPEKAVVDAGESRFPALSGACFGGPECRLDRRCHRRSWR